VSHSPDIPPCRYEKHTLFRFREYFMLAETMQHANERAMFGKVAVGVDIDDIEVYDYGIVKHIHEVLKHGRGI
jgi:hypothetical protein